MSQSLKETIVIFAAISLVAAIAVAGALLWHNAHYTEIDGRNLLRPENEIIDADFDVVLADGTKTVPPGKKKVWFHYS